MPALSTALENKRFLTKLLLDNNKIGPQGAAILAQGIKSNETLTNLHLANCGLLEEGTLEIANVLSNKKNLLVLDMTNNKTGVNGCISICKAI